MDNYIFGAKGELNSSLRCKLCGERSAVKSNVGIAEELDRLLSDLYPQMGAPGRIRTAYTCGPAA